MKNKPARAYRKPTVRDLGRMSQVTRKSGVMEDGNGNTYKY